MIKENEIKEVTKQLILLLEKYNNGKISYQIDQLKRINKILNSDINNHEKEKEIREIVENIYPQYGGLTDFHI